MDPAAEPLRKEVRIAVAQKQNTHWSCLDYGNNVCFNRWWFVKDSCGIVCCVFTWLLLAYAEFAVNVVIIASAIARDAVYFAIINGVLFNGLVLFALISHIRAAMTEPGIVPKNTATDERIRELELAPGTVIMRCPKCICIKPDRAHHCSICKRCVNNCIGENNQKYFVLFTMYIATLSLHAIIMTVHQFILCVDKEFLGCSAMNPPTSIILLIFLLFEGLLFFLFTCIMFCTQLCAIWNDETGIEQLQSDKERSWARRKRFSGLRAVFGDNCSIWWLSPFSTPRLMGNNKPYHYSVLPTSDEV
ncbi:Palmitoyltransferase ZDHHC3 [Hypsibius exemplaris]|uniref:Palmitoyltransferase n=1 Tax=Hypsibius exemplaris TaxID=2072580 RepID=A0A9X6RPE4_HYPEX|nr:Palmitoyltransferase ZDHHC3 [Hypsibius exemplaris]